MEKKYLSQNGIPIYVYENDSSHGFFLSLFVRCGSMYENECESGITHFLEHVAIRNINYCMGGGLYAELDKYGIEFNASTYSEMIQFYLSGASENFRVAAEVASKLLLPIALPKDEIDRERGRIRAEIRESDDRSSLAGFTAEHVWEGTSLSRSITGVPKSVSRITGRKLEEYRRRTFTPENLFFYITGRVSKTDINYLSELVARATLGEGEKHCNIAPVPNFFGKRGAKVEIKNADFTKVRFTFDLDMSSLSVPEIDLLYEIVLGGYDSKFFIELSEKRGLFYDLTGASERYKNVGTFSFAYELREVKLYEAVEMTVELLRELKTVPLHPDRCMKAGFVDNAYMLYDDIRELNFTFGYDNHILELGYGDIKDRLEAYRAVTPERLLAVAKEIFTPDNLTLTLKGNKKKIDTDRLKEIILAL